MGGHCIVLRQDEAARLALRSIGAGKGAGLHQLCVAVMGAGGCAAQLDAGNSRLGHRLQLIRLADAVLVQVAPDAHVGVLGVLGVEQPVSRTTRGICSTTHIQFSQGGKAMGGLLAICQQGFITKEFAARVDDAVAIAVQHQQAVVGIDPGGIGTDGVAVAVELDALGQGGNFQAVAVQVQDQRVDHDELDSFYEWVRVADNYCRKQIAKK